jgi:hypothetical protein
MAQLFNNTTLIKPAPNSGKFFRDDPQTMTAAVQEFYAEDANGNKKLVKSTPYTAQRFDGTKQGQTPVWNFRKRRWTIIDPEDITKKRQLEKNSKKLDSMVKSCKLVNDVKSSPDFGKFIESTDIHNRRDPFMINKETRINLGAGEAVVPSGEHDVKNVIVLLSLMTQKKFQVGSGAKNGITGTQVRYVIVDKETDRKEKNISRTRDKKAREFYDNLSDDKKMKIAISLSLVRSLDTDRGLVDDLIYDYITDGETKVVGTNMTKQEMFISLCDSGNAVVEASYIFHLGKTKGVIRMQNKVYQAFGEKLGSTINESVNFLSLEDNDLYERIKEAVEVIK